MNLIKKKHDCLWKQETIKINIYSFTLILSLIISHSFFSLFLAIDKPTWFSLSSSLNCITCIVYSMITSLFVKHRYFGRFCCWVNPLIPINAHRFLDKWQFIVKTIVQKFRYLKPLPLLNPQKLMPTIFMKPQYSRLFRNLN